MEEPVSVIADLKNIPRHHRLAYGTNLGWFLLDIRNLVFFFFFK